MEDRDLPIYIEACGKTGRITDILPKTRCVRIYRVHFDNGEVKFYRGAATRPSWIDHILKKPIDRSV